MDPIQYINRSNNKLLEEKVPGKGLLRWLYFNPIGKLALSVIVKRKFISALAGWYMNKRSSAKRIQKFVNEHKVELSEYVISNSSEYNTFNHFFYRKLKPESRPVEENLVSPADGKILIFPTIDLVNKFFIKGTEFTLNSFLNNKNLVEKYQGGSMAIIRLAPADYHRFHFPASGEASVSTIIKGNYYSVSPIALGKNLEIFCQNQREYCILKTKEYGEILYLEVGATMVGSIIQTYKADSIIQKGDEKGYFAFGGSTIVLLFEKDKISFDADLLENTQKGFETTIHMGEQIAQ